MNDFSDLETRLSQLRPAPIRQEFASRLEAAIANAGAEVSSRDNIIRPEHLRLRWAIGIGLAAAAAVLLLVRLNFGLTEKTSTVTSLSPPPQGQSLNSAPSVRDEFVPFGTTQVVYHTRDEGLVFPGTGKQPVRRLRSHMRETLQWQNPATGASLRVSYPSEQVELIPVSGQ